nr:GNAT family N-acetyltransferase [Tianweitania sediminis]
MQRQPPLLTDAWEGVITTTPETVIRPLTAADAAAYRAIRMEALHDTPEAFSASPEDEADLSDADMALRCEPAVPGVTIGAFSGATLIGTACYLPERRAKTRHKATMVAVYLKPAWRKTGVGRAMVEAIIAHARKERVILLCNATMHNLPARRLYHALGFVPYGVERDALIINGQSYDEELLMLDLRQDQPAAE